MNTILRINTVLLVIVTATLFRTTHQRNQAQELARSALNQTGRAADVAAQWRDVCKGLTEIVIRQNQTLSNCNAVLTEYRKLYPINALTNGFRTVTAAPVSPGSRQFDL